MKRIIYLAVCVLPLFVLSLTDVCAQSRYHARKGLEFLEIDWRDHAFNEFKQGEAAGEEESAYRLAECYIEETGTPRNLPKARALFEKWYTKSPEMCWRAMLYYMSKHSVDFVSGKKSSPWHGYKPRAIEPNMKMCWKYVQYAKNNFEYSEYLEECLNLIEAYFYARGEGGITRNIAKAVNYNEKDKSYDDTNIYSLIESNFYKLQTLGDIGVLVAELRAIGLESLLMGTNIEGRAEDIFKATCGLDKNKYHFYQWDDADIAKINNTLKSCDANTKEGIFVVLGDIIGNCVEYWLPDDINNKADHEDWLNKLKVLKKIPYSDSCDNYWIAAFEKKIKYYIHNIDHYRDWGYKHSLPVDRDYLSKINKVIDDLINLPLVQDKDRFIKLQESCLTQIEILNNREELVNKGTEAMSQVGKLRRSVPRENAEVIKWYSEKSNEMYNKCGFQITSNVDLHLVPSADILTLLEELPKIQEVLTTAINFDSIIRDINNSHQKFISELSYLPGANKSNIEIVKSSYLKSYNSIDFNWSPKVSGEELKSKVDNLHNGIKEYFEISNRIASDDMAFESEYKKLKAHYSNYLLLRNAINTKYDVNNSIEDAENRIKALRENFRTYQNLLAEQDNTNSAILAKGKSYKNIIAPYNTYFKGVNRIWKNEDSVSEAQGVGEIQKKLLTVLEHPNLETINKEIKKQGITTLDGVFSYIESLN